MLKNASSAATQALLFAKNFFKHPRLVGSVVPSSPFLIRSLLAQIAWHRAAVVVEYGPGLGNFTREILARLPKNGVLVAIEMNEEFVRHLRSEFRDPRLRVVCGSAVNVRSILNALHLPPADYIISCLPFSIMSDAMRDQIFQESHQALGPDGVFLMYQYNRRVLASLEPVFARVEEDFELLNIPPAQLFYCSR